MAPNYRDIAWAEYVASFDEGLEGSERNSDVLDRGFDETEWDEDFDELPRDEAYDDDEGLGWDD